MSKNINFNTGEKTNVSKRVIDFGPLDTESVADDMETWNSMQLMGDDKEEKEYKSPQKISAEAERKLSQMKSKSIGFKLLSIFNTEVA